MSESIYLDIIPLNTKGTPVLTYSSDQKLDPGSIVKIPYGKKEIFGVVESITSKPKFKTKPVIEVIDLPTLPEHTLDLAKWISEYYGAELSESLALMIPNRPDIKSREKQNTTQRTSETRLDKQFELNKTQENVIATILDKPDKAWLLHGVTGSGKTAVYIELAKRTIAEGKSVNILVPEIALTKHIIEEFRAHIDVPILSTNSKMTSAQRRLIWHSALKSTKPIVTIGPRSSLFLPHKNLGLIILDECHESSYKNESTPNYHARDVAAKLSGLTGSKLVLGSATPSTQDILLHRKNRLSIIEMPEAINSNPREIEIVDLRQSKLILSTQLQSELKKTFQSKHQSLLFINRRGSASQVICSDCGLVEICPKCQIPQTWHGDIGKLQCHWCGQKASLPTRCSQCQSTNRRFIGVGTKRVESEVRKLLPQARIERLDRDSFSAKTIEDVIDKLNNHKVDVLIGTQMIAKGLDLPKVTLIGIVLADTSLHIPDLYSNEKTYQLLHQVIGRSGRRANQPSKVILQTYSPDHRAIKLATEHKFDQFIEEELQERQALGYPPYRYLLKLTCKRKTQSGAQKAARELAKKIETQYPKIFLRGPAPSWQETKAGYWYWHIVLTSNKRSNLLQVMKELPANWRADIDPVDLL
ncbi:MAG: primosomal protein N' [Candidatus Saccharimonadales bacterium]